LPHLDNVLQRERQSGAVKKDLRDIDAFAGAIIDYSVIPTMIAVMSLSGRILMAVWGAPYRSSRVKTKI
jgi:hypothetical protein